MDKRKNDEGFDSKILYDPFKEQRALSMLLVIVIFGHILFFTEQLIAKQFNGTKMESLGVDHPAIENLGPAVTQLSIMTGHLAGDTHFVFSRNTVPGELVGINVDSGEITTQLKIQLGNDRSTEAFSMSSIDNELFIGVRFEERQLSIIRVNIETGEYSEVVNLHPAQMARDMTVSPDGKIYAAMSHQYGARVYEFDPQTDEGHWIGSFATVSRQSAEAVVATEDHVYVGNGVSAPDLWKYDRKTGDKVSIIPEEYRQNISEVFSLGLHDEWLIAGGRGDTSDPIVALINLDDPSEYRLINHGDGLVQSIVAFEDIIYFGSGDGTWSYDLYSEEMKRISNLRCNRGLFFRDGVLHGTDGRRQIGMYDLKSGDLNTLDLADAGADEWPEPGQSMAYSDGVVYISGHHAVGMHDINRGIFSTMQVSGEAKHMISVPSHHHTWPDDLYWGAYGSGELFRYNTTTEQLESLASAPSGNNRPRAVAYDSINGFLMMGTQADNAGGGALTIYDINKSQTSWIHQPFQNQAVGAVTTMNGIVYLASNRGRVDPGRDARVAAWDPVSKEKLWEITPVSNNQRIRSLIAYEEHLIGLTRSGHLFVVNPRQQTVEHLERIITGTDAGRLRVKNDKILAVSHDKILSINPKNHETTTIIDGLESQWFHWPDVAIDDNGHIFALKGFDLIQIIPRPSKPELVYPSSLSTVSTRPVFTWETASYAQQYQFQITETNFSDILMDTLVSKIDFEYPYDLKAGQNHRWRVRGLRKLEETIIKGLWSDDILFFTKESTSTVMSNDIPTQFILEQNHPNPFNSSTNINYGLPTRAYVTLGVYDVLGRKLKTLVDKEQQAGYHGINFDAGDMASGIYLYRFDVIPLTDHSQQQIIKTRNLTLVN